MHDLLTRLKIALPSVVTWMGQLKQTHAASATPIDVHRFPRLATYLSDDVLAPARVVVVPRAPFPPVTTFGLSEFGEMEAAPMAAITFEHVYYVEAPHASHEPTHFHELIHTIQWRTLGVRDFLLTYGVGLALNGYEASPLEAIAYSYQDAFERGRALNRLNEAVSSHAIGARAQAQLIFAASQVEWGA